MANEGQNRTVVMVIDDDPDIRESISMSIEMQGYLPLVTANGVDALTLLRKGARPCLILLDIMMPEMNGEEFRKEQLSDPALALIPVVVITGAGIGFDRTLFSEIDVLKKPFTYDALMAKIGSFAGRSSNRQKF